MLYSIDLKFVESVSVPTLDVETVMESFWLLVSAGSCKQHACLIALDVPFVRSV